MENIIENIRNAFESIKIFFNDLWNSVKKILFKIYSNNAEFRALNNRYMKTKKKRTKKKYYNRMINFIVKDLIVRV